MAHARNAAVLAALSILTIAAGCSTEDDTPSTTRYELRGTYEAEGAGPISEITFTRDMHYELRKPGCTHAGCAEHGDYAFDAAQKNLLLTDGATAATRSLSIAVLQLDPPPTGEALIAPKDMVSRDREPLVTPSETPLTQPTAQSALIEGQPVRLTTRNGTCLIAHLQTGILTDEAGKPLLGGECGFYEKKACDPGKVINYYREDVLRLFADTAGCVACGGTLTGAAIVAAGGSVGSNGLLTVPAGALATTMAAAGCVGCWKSVEDSGLVQAIDCSLVPCQYSTEGRQKECQMTCQTAYAYVPQVGYACQCTNNATEACCRIGCMDGYQINDQCTCDRIQR